MKKKGVKGEENIVSSRLMHSYETKAKINYGKAYLEELYYSKKDKEELEKMPALKREEILANRFEMKNDKLELNKITNESTLQKEDVKANAIKTIAVL